jgi:hypothetical protein
MGRLNHKFCSSIFFGNALLILAAYAPFTQKTNFKIVKKLEKFIPYISTFYVITYSFIVK